uniref:Uncharacterized protein n=1 Tax=Eucampia antarctica TaxID=49252 RepID=A0A7S2RP78_9STRA|mmetsp:Transcript_24942/g.23947  ORF Transcript_24942/g.23947 Transcript_24942/m.23947 type:complete len:103 (+) Transcript_24942:258-566(+)
MVSSQLEKIVIGKMWCGRNILFCRGICFEWSICDSGFKLHWEPYIRSITLYVIGLVDNDTLFLLIDVKSKIFETRDEPFGCTIEDGGHKILKAIVDGERFER